MGKSRVVREAINGDALRNEFKIRKITLIDASLKLGYDASYLSHAVRDGLMRRSAMLLIQAMYNIDPDIYCIKAEKVESKKEETAVVEVVQHSGLSDDDLEKLYKVIYSAVYKATKRALEE